MSSAREHILERLRIAQPQHLADIEQNPPPLPNWSLEERIEQFKTRMAMVRGEVLVCTQEEWSEQLQNWLRDRKLRNLLYANDSDLGTSLTKAWEGQSDLPTLIRREGPVESWKEELFFEIDGSITSSHAGIAETGTLILSPTQSEPRSYSLVPPIHIAILDADHLYNTFEEAVEREPWEQGMPTNLLLISGPSKSADIEQTLAYGVHGPTDLLVILRV